MSETLTQQLQDLTNQLVALQVSIGEDGLTLGNAESLLSLSTSLGGLSLAVSLSGDSGLQVELADDNATVLALQALCFLRGTHILTERGELPVEALEIGDRVITPQGPEASMPIRWIGRQHYEGDAARFVQPVLVCAGALGNNLPHRDLHLSADHCLFLSGRLVPAKLLVNGATIIAEHGFNAVEYINIELDRHSVVFAEGVASETYLDCGNRHRFHSTAESGDFLATRTAGTDSAWTDGSAFAAPLWEGPELESLRAQFTPAKKQQAA